jgi:monofunctional biosynthetic peptidoglycan transglycosylase
MLRSWISRFVRLALALLALLYLFWTLSLVLLRFIDPLTTGVQMQRFVEAKLSGLPYHKRYKFVPLPQISPNLLHAVIAAEDGHFYQHHGIDWEQVEKVAQESSETGRIRRGASTITQQLVKNLFFTTHRNPVRKAFEYTLAPLADGILGKRRVLELYLNVACGESRGLVAIELRRRCMVMVFGCSGGAINTRPPLDACLHHAGGDQRA